MKKIKKVLLSIVVLALICAIAYISVFFIIPEVKYKQAISMMDNQKYVEAIEAFQNMKEYKDSEDYLDKCNYMYSLQLIDEGQYDLAIERLSSIETLENDQEIQKAKYLKAKSLIENGDYENATAVLQEIDYQDSYELLKEISFKDIAVGKSLFLGKMDLDNEKENGLENIEWIVLDINGGKALLISKYVLFLKPFNNKPVQITWEKSPLRKYLNEDFIMNSFTDDERNMIMQTTVLAEWNQSNANREKYNPGKNTIDRIFIPSYKEIVKYFNGVVESSVLDIAYSETVETSTYNGASVFWVLRNPGLLPGCMSCVIGHKIQCDGLTINFANTGVRPCMWIKIPA